MSFCLKETYHCTAQDHGRGFHLGKRDIWSVYRLFGKHGNVERRKRLRSEFSVLGRFLLDLVLDSDARGR